MLAEQYPANETYEINKNSLTNKMLIPENNEMKMKVKERKCKL